MILEDPKLPAIPPNRPQDWLPRFALWMGQYLRRLVAQVNWLGEGRIAAASSATTAAPTGGTWAAGDFVRNSAPTEVTSGITVPYVVLGWVCTVGGTPGTWEEVRVQTAATLSTYGWEDTLADISAGRAVGANAPAWTQFREGIYAYAFSATIMKEIWVNVHVTHNHAAGTKFYPHVHWSTTGTNNGTVIWGIEYTVAKGHNQEAWGATDTIYVTQNASGTAYQHMIAEVSDDDAIAVDEVDSVILMRIFRDATNDSCSDVAFAFFVDCHYQVDRSFGTKNKAPNFYSG